MGLQLNNVKNITHTPDKLSSHVWRRFSVQIAIAICLKDIDRILFYQMPSLQVFLPTGSTYNTLQFSHGKS